MMKPKNLIETLGSLSPDTLDELDFEDIPELPEAKIRELATCAFVERRQHVVLVARGVGKTQIAHGLEQRARLAGYTTLFTTAEDMLSALRVARAQHALDLHAASLRDAAHPGGAGAFDRELQRLAAPDVLVIDDFGLRPLQGDEPADLHDVLERRRERSTIVTSKREIKDWYAVFGDRIRAVAALNCLLPTAHVVSRRARCGC